MADRVPREPLEWNGRMSAGDARKTVHRLFEEQADRQPHATAVEFKGDTLTYGELNARANALARQLRRLGVGPEVLVGLCVERSFDAIVGLLGILKAGGAYLPLDPDYPEERLRFMVEDSGAHALVTHAAAEGRGIGLLPAERVVFLDPAALADADGAVNVESGVEPHSLAYVMYTSGSTGKPKGVEIEHASMANQVGSAAQRFGTSSGERVLQFASLGFDASVQEIFASLVGGATLVLRSEEMLSSVSNFLASCREQHLTVLDLPTAYWHELVSVASAEGLSLPEPLRLIVIGGERALPERFAQWGDLAGDRVGLINAYGPTEATVAATFWEAPRENRPEAARTVPIGRPIANVQTYVLDRKLRPVPIGVVGDLYVGGAGVARGYRNRPELTAEMFIPDPFRRGEARLYRTGDRARFLTSGDLEYLGRVDGQIKLRFGFRVEPGEIETAMRGLPGVRDAVVRPHEDAPGETRLVAYFVADPAGPASVKDLRRLLKQTLPLHLVPSTFVRVEALPVNASGKLDPARLPPPGPVRPESAEDYAVPRTPLERELVGIWSAAMRVERVGIDDDFFDLGGHSLLAMQLISRVRDAFGVNLPVRDLFAAPTVAGLASRIEARLGERAAGPDSPAIRRASGEAILRRGGSEPAPLSSSQERLWVLDALIAGTALYNIPYAARLRGPLDVPALGRAFDAVEERHEVLRSVFPEVAGGAVQGLGASGARALAIFDLSALPEDLRDAEIERTARAEALRPFDLERGPLLRTTLLRFSAQEHVLLVTFHHILFDGWSVEIFARDLAAFYEAFRTERPADLPALPIQYADFAAWQRASLEGASFQEHLSYWKRQLSGAPFVVELPADRPRPAVQTFAGAEETVSIPKPVADGLRTIAQREGATLFMTLLAAFQVFLHRHGAQEDMLIGSPVSGRNRMEVEELIGFFVNTLVFRADLSGDPTFRELLGRVRETALEAYSHDEMPFERLVEELNPERTLSHSPLVQVMMLLQERTGPLTLSGISSTSIRVAPSMAKFELTAVFENADGDLTASFQYRTDLFDPSTVRRMLGRLNVLLAGIAENPDSAVSRLPVLTEEERDLALVRWNDTASEYPRETPIHHLFEQQAAATPEAKAVLFGIEHVTYGELNRRANRLARHLLRRGVGRGDLVGLCLERSVEMVVGLLAILKAGGAYVPMDPRYPRQRLAFLLEDTGARLVLTLETFLDALPEGLYDCVRLDADSPLIAAESAENVGSPAAAEDLAYVMYTSGSTGAPKGVCIRHRSVVRLVRGAGYARFSGEVFLQFAPMSFDASTFEIWGALLNGSRLALMPPGVPSLQELGEALERYGVTTLWLTAGLFHQMVETEIESLRGLRQLLAGGDVLSVPHVLKALEELPGCSLINGYGPTESTTFACCHLVGRHEAPGASVPIGRPIANTRAYVLDRNRRPVPIGVAGELCIGGDGLALEYLRSPELTAQKFFADPFVDGGRLYATGDRVRWRGDGKLEFLGRIDEQLKLRGFRIEPGEIESVLARHALVAASVVMAREDAPGDRRLVAYVVRRDGKRDAIPRLREAAASSLPEHMVPSAFVFLDSLPLTANGKVDRRALPAPDTSRPQAEKFAAPRSDLERSIARIWSDVLRLDRVGVHENFFELGGHSLLATRVISCVRDSLRLEVSLRTLFQFPTVARFAEAVSGAVPAPGHRTDDRLDERLSWWRSRLADLPLSDLPADFPRPASPDPRVARRAISLPPPLVRALEALSVREGATLSTALLAAFQLLLSRHTGQEDVPVGSVRTGVIRTDLSGDPTFLDLMGRVRKVSADALTHALPIDDLAAALDPASKSPVVRVFFEMADRAALEAAGAGGIPQPFDLALFARKGSDGLSLLATWDARLFEEARIAEMLDQLAALLQQIVDAPEMRIGAYSLVTAAARRVLPDPAAPIVERPMEPVTDTFLSWAARTPLAPAIVCEGRVSTYEDLERRSRRIAETLVRQGLAPRDVVGVGGPRGPGMIAAMLGVLRSGAVLLTLDPALPARRRNLMLAEARACRVLRVGSGSEEAAESRGPSSLPMIELDENGEFAGADPSASAVTLPAVRSGDPAYIFFTSGTSGVPKAVLGSHKGLAHFIEWERETFHVAPGDRCSHLTGLSFDAVLRDIFVPLTSGASLHVPGRSEDVGSSGTISWLEREGITIIHAVPSLVQAWLAELPAAARLARLRLAFFAGEPLTDSFVRRWRSAFPESGGIVNLYGPTETTLVKCFFVVPEEPRPGIQPIGNPLPETQALVLRDGSRPCGIGELGEIVLRTPFASLGYVNTTREQAHRFLRNPFRVESGSAGGDRDLDLLYRSGDRGRYAVDGSLTIHGRLDDQVKVRGVRIEPAEVASVLSSHPRVSSCAVVARIDARGETALTAYVVRVAGGRETGVDLRRYLLARLPAAMTPSHFVFLDRLPVTPNGKLDRAALPAPALEDAPAGGAAAERERKPAEKTLIGVWSGILGVETIGPEDDFFAVGGHSLNATQVMAAASLAFGIELPVQMLFEHPTVSALAAAIQERREAGEAAAGAPSAAPDRSPDAIARRADRDGPVPLSFAQQRLWVVDRLDPGLATYNVPRAFRLRGAVDVEALGRAVEEIQERHEVLRTSFVLADGASIPNAVLNPASPLQVVDLGALPEETREAEALRIVEDDAARPFDLARGPLLRATLLRLGAEDAVLHLNIHHAVFDGWSVNVFDGEFRKLYEANGRGEATALPALPIQYTDFAIWQTEWLRGGVLEEQLSYWKRQLAGAPPILDLSGRPRPSVQTFRGAAENFSISKPVANAIRSFGQREGATLFMTLLAALDVLLMRHSGQEDILVGSPVAGRNRSEIEGLIGFFVNTLVFRGDLSGDPTFRELLGRIREASIDAFAHQDVPFERLVEELNPQRSLSHSPLFQVMMSLQNGAGERLSLPGLAVAPLRLAAAAASAKFDLSVSFAETATGEIAGTLQYNVDVLNAAAARGMASQLEILLRGIADDPDRPVSQLPLLTARERQRMLVLWNETAADYPASSTVHELFQRQAERTPDAPAVRDGRESVTFRELDRRANRLAHFLRGRAVKPETAVGVCLERSARIPEALLGVLKAGGAWVPLDPAFPAERLAFMLLDSGAKVLLTETNIAERFAGADAEIIRLDSDRRPAGEPETPPSGGAQPDGLAYVIYTSGSTGTPKGVETTHRAMVNRLAWMWRAYPFAAGEICCHKTALSFVDSVWEIFGPLLAGVPGVVLPDETVRDPRALVESLAAGEITRIVLVPSLLRALLGSGIDLAETLPSLRLWTTSGEVLPIELYRQFRAAMPGAMLVNLYGSSEVSADVTSWDSRSAEPRESVPIGRPIANTQVYILDGHGQPVPVGAAGELFVGGHALARGYRNLPELTAERFVADPFRKEPGARLFRTGDRARYCEDGQIEYLGRTDFQVKLHGRRIEPGEIETALGSHNAVAQAVVAVREDRPGEPRLVAWVVPNPGQKPGTVELRGFLRNRLPDFMVPSTFLFLDALPLTNSGKVDRSALPAPDASRPELAAAFEAPRNPVEEKIAKIWREILGVQEVGVHDNFFDLGGHSLVAVAVIARIEKELGRSVGLATIFRAPTVAELAVVFREKRRSRHPTPSLVPIQPLGSRPPFFCVHANTGIVYYRRLARFLGPDQPFFGLQSQGLDGTRAPYETVEEMAAHYVREIRGLQPQGPYYLGGHSFGGKVAFEMARQLGQQGQRTAFLGFFDTFNLPITPRPTGFQFARQRTRVHIAALKTAGLRGKVSYLIRRAQTLGHVIARVLARGGEAVFYPMLRAQRKVLEANSRAAERYVPGYYEGRATIFRAMDRTDEFRDRLRPYPHLGWETLCGEGVLLVEVPGDHASLLEEEESVRALSRRLEECLRAAQTRTL
ncbi:MAG: amino acid adenylation domain-containing protein [Acidobacteriota bacterium]|nr:amino acid adenylation domain-containing protein [Acidobacteriota bacterium]